MEEVTLIIKEDGPRAVLTARRPDDGRGLYKAWLVGARGRYLLGTMAPEGKSLGVKRTISLDELRRSGAWPPERAEAELSFAFPGAELPPGWSLAADPASLFSERELSRAVGGLSGALVKMDSGGFQVAAPYDEKKEFPITPLFCFSQVKELGGKTYTIFCFDDTGWPYFPNNGSGREPY
ncbi:MAG: hypothetical protein EOM52_03490 [Clostridia bacterium]|nr:hypothetical protein [Clostridia bacterium]